MSLRSKILLILCAVVVLNAAADYVVQRSMVEGSFASLERQEARHDVGRALELLEGELADLEAWGRRWGSWRPTWEFVQGGRPGYVADNLGAGALASARLDVLYLCDADRRIVWGAAEIGEERRPARLPMLAVDQLPATPFFVPFDQARAERRPITAEDDASGLLLTDEGPLLVCVAPILPGPVGGEWRGAVVLGRFLDGALLADLGGRAHMSLSCWPLDAAELPVPPDFVDRVTGEAPRPVVGEASEETLHAYAVFPDLRRMPALLLRAEVPREILAEGRASVNYALLSTLGTALAILFVLYRLLQRIVIGPLARLTAHAVEIGRTDDTRRKVGMDGRSDEFGTLSREFDGMLEKLAESRAAHAETARKVGMSEIATGVLHNVGNVLNSVNVSTNVVRGRVDALKVDDLVAVKDVLGAHRDDLGRFVTEDERGRHLLPFLDGLSGTLVAQRDSILDELQSLGTGVEHIIELVRSQQSYAGLTGLYENASIAKQLEQALDITRQALVGEDDVRVERDYEDVGDVLLDRRKVIETFVNIIQNARRAMDDAGGEKVLTFRIRKHGDRIRVEVRDTGVGIPPENLIEIFHHGFTTKPDGHGFGLHTCANAATEMGGRLWAESDGPGRGANFVLELPLEAGAARAAA